MHIVHTIARRLLPLALVCAGCGAGDSSFPVTLEGKTFHMGVGIVTQDLDQGLRILTMMNVDDTCLGVGFDDFRPLEPADELAIIQEGGLQLEGRNVTPAVDAKIAIVLDTGSDVVRTYSSGLGTPGDFIEVTPVSIEGEQIDLRLTFHTKFVGQDATTLDEPGVLEASFLAPYCPPLVPP